ncbi:MAG: SDR family oxidoreductase [Propionibacteriales bacterium]|nr:SDR family oxidoreductase [Propionibacteriales bacterium]
MSGLTEGKIGVVTGAASGIGRAVALAFAREGGSLVIADLNEQGCRTTAQTIADMSGEVHPAVCDVTEAKDVHALVAQVVGLFGALDCAFNCAGVEGPFGKTGVYEEAAWRHVIDVNLTGTWLAMRAELGQMVQQERGAIVNIASVAGLRASHGMPAYTASKHGVVGLTKTAALEYANTEIRVNAVCPGIVDTPMLERITEDRSRLWDRLIARTPYGRPARAEEIAEAAVWLGSDRSSYMTGHAMPVDGGYVAM